MKKIKILLLVILIMITCTGCSVEYNINITQNTIEEMINVTDSITSNRTKEEILNHYETWYPTFVNFIEDGESIEIEDFSEKVEGIKYHEKSIKEFNNGYNYTYKYTYSTDEYYDSYVLASVFPETTVYKEYDKLVIRTSEENFLCDYDYFDSAKVNITIDPKVYELNYTNSTKKNKNTYTWELNRNNCSNSEIILTLNKKNNDTSNNEFVPNNKKENPKENFIEKYMLYIFCGVLIILIIIGSKWINKLKNNNSDIDD